MLLYFFCKIFYISIRYNMTTYNLPSAAVNAALTLAPAIGTNTATTITTANDATLAGALSAATLKTVFKFKTDALDLTDVDTEFVADVSSSLFALESGKVVSAASVDSGDQVDSNASEQSIEYDYIRHVAQQLLGHRKADIFSNEATLRGVVTDQDSLWVSEIQEALSTNDQACINELMNTLTSSSAGRTTLANLTEYSNDSGVSTFEFPFASGDTLVVPVTFNALSGQAITNTNITDGEVSARTYNVSFAIVD
jgi:hypothetical protein